MGFLILFLILGYILPAAIAFLRKHKDAPAIAALNIFFGWSIAGWFMALFWALSDPRGRGNQTVIVNTTQHLGPAYAPLQPDPVLTAQPIGRLALAVDERRAIAFDDRDMAFWDGMKDKNDPDLLEEYLIRFPTGQFSQLARNRLARGGVAVSTLARDESTPSPQDPDATAGSGASVAPSARQSSTAISNMATVCAECGTNWEADARFCSECGGARM